MNIAEKKSHLQTLGVHDLRNIARLWGVPTPTTKLKNELIEYILRAFSGDKSFVKKNNSGRPAKITAETRFYEKELYPEGFEDFITSRLHNFEEDNRVFTFNQDLKHDLEHIVINNGYLLERENFYYFVDISLDKVVFVPNIIVFEKKLEIGDFIKTRSITFDDRYFAVKDILEINDVEIEKFNRELCLFKDITNSKNVVSGVEEGSKNYYDENDLFDTLKKEQQSLQNLISNDYKLSILCVKLEAIKILQIRKIINIKEFVSYSENDPLYSFETINNAINNAIILAREGQKIVLLVYDIENIIKELNTYFELKGEQKSNGNCSGTITLIRKLLNLNRTLKNGGSITLLISKFAQNFDEKNIL